MLLLVSDPVTLINNLLISSNLEKSENNTGQNILSYNNSKAKAITHSIIDKIGKVCLPLLSPISVHMIIQLVGYFSFNSEYSRAFSGV